MGPQLEIMLRHPFSDTVCLQGNFEYEDLTFLLLGLYSPPGSGWQLLAVSPSTDLSGFVR